VAAEGDFERKLEAQLKPGGEQPSVSYSVEYKAFRDEQLSKARTFYERACKFSSFFKAKLKDAVNRLMPFTDSVKKMVILEGKKNKPIKNIGFLREGKEDAELLAIELAVDAIGLYRIGKINLYASDIIWNTMKIEGIDKTCRGKLANFEINFNQINIKDGKGKILWHKLNNTINQYVENQERKETDNA